MLEPGPACFKLDPCDLAQPIFNCCAYYSDSIYIFGFYIEIIYYKAFIILNTGLHDEIKDKSVVQSQ